MTSADADTNAGLDAEAEALLDRLLRPKRRVRPRLAEPLNEAEDREIETPAGPVMAWRLGSGPAVLLVHGWEDDNALWGPMIDAFQANGRAVVALDLPGHGFSQAELNGPPSAGEAVKAAAEALGPIQAVVGHSFGCVALTAALDGGMTAKRAVLIASPIPRSRVEALERQKQRGAPPEVVDRAIELFAARGVADRFAFDLEAAAARMTAKGLIVHSMDDDNCPPENARVLADAWPGADLMWVDGLGHRAVAQDGDVIRSVADFIDGFG